MEGPIFIAVMSCSQVTCSEAGAEGAGKGREACADCVANIIITIIIIIIIIISSYHHIIITIMSMIMIVIIMMIVMMMMMMIVMMMMMMMSIIIITFFFFFFQCLGIQLESRLHWWWSGALGIAMTHGCREGHAQALRPVGGCSKVGRKSRPEHFRSGMVQDRISEAGNLRLPSRSGGLGWSKQ